jgi:hypothetical protein
MNKEKDIFETNSHLFADIRELINHSRQSVAVAVNAEMSLLY